MRTSAKINGDAYMVQADPSDIPILRYRYEEVRRRETQMPETDRIELELGRRQ